jgi:Fatty acid hydroxylase superfamily
MSARAEYGPEIKTLGQAAREFAKRHSPWMILAAVTVLAIARALIGDLDWRDAVAVAAMLVVYPFGEWAIHVYLLHLRPFALRGRRLELATAGAHREHHEQPGDLSLILLAPVEVLGLLFVVVPLVAASAGAVIALAGRQLPDGAVVTGIVTGQVLAGIYEWTHFLIHTAYRPRSRYYRSIWRNHRLHHFKNEHYWHGITNTMSDWVLGTFLDQREVPRSPTARTLVP